MNECECEFMCVSWDGCRYVHFSAKRNSDWNDSRVVALKVLSLLSFSFEFLSQDEVQGREGELLQARGKSGFHFLLSPSSILFLTV